MQVCHYELDLDNVKVNPRANAKYVGQRSFRLKVIVQIHI